MSGHRSIAILAFVLLFGACGGTGSSDPELTIVATTTILGDVVSNVAGADAEVIVLTPVGVDPHEFIPSAAQVADLNRADLVVANGLGLEEGLSDVLEAARADGVRVLDIALAVDPITFGDGGLDPHVWFDPIRMQRATQLIQKQLGDIYPDIDWRARADEYTAALGSLDTEIAATLQAVPEQNRQLVTNHDSLGYFAERYGLEIVGTVIPGGSTLGDPSSRELADLVDTIRRVGTSAIFVESTLPATLAQAVAAELGSSVSVVPLYSGSVGEPGSGAETLMGMLRINAQRIADALGP